MVIGSKASIYKITSLPPTGNPNAIYYLKQPSKSVAEIYITDAGGQFLPCGNKDIIQDVFDSLATDLVTTSDVRLSNSREWIADTIPQAEAEGGSATTRRAWTAERVRQAFTSFFGAISSSLGSTLIGRATPALMRTDLELGTAATGNVVGVTGASTTDVMSQKSVTDELDAINLLIGDASTALDAINGEVI